MTPFFFAVATAAGAAALWYCGTILFLCAGLRRLPPAGQAGNHCFSIVIAARNEAPNIAALLDSVMAQTIPVQRYEVIIVNDRSTDETAAIVEGYANRFPNLRLYSINAAPPGIAPKKYAVSRGVAASRHEIIVFTDADCSVPATWLETIDRHFSDPVGLVQGITAYRQVRGMNRLFFSLQALDFLSHGIVAAAAIGAGLPINSNANNFAFRRSAFNEAGGLTEKIGHVVSGDDDLLLQKIWKTNRWDIIFMTDPAGAVTTMPTMTPRELFHQRARWGSKTVHYNPKQAVLLAGVFLFYLSIVVSAVLSPAAPRILWCTTILMLIKYTGESMVMIPGLRRFNHPELMPLLPLASLLQLPLVLAAVIVGLFGKFMWKDQSFSRTIKQHTKIHATDSPESGKSN